MKVLGFRLVQTPRFKPSGPNIPNAQRHTAQLLVRCPPDLAAKVRELAAERGLTLADVLAAGYESLNKENGT